MSCLELSEDAGGKVGECVRGFGAQHGWVHSGYFCMSWKSFPTCKPVGFGLLGPICLEGGDTEWQWMLQPGW